MVRRNRTSKSLIIGVGGFILILCVIWVLRLLGTVSPPDPLSTEFQVSENLGDASADRPEETVQALAGTVESIKTRINNIAQNTDSGIDSVREEIRTFTSRVEDLKREQHTADTRAESRFEKLRDELLRTTDERLAQLEDRFDNEYPIATPRTESRSPGVLGQDGLIWHTALKPDPLTLEPGWQKITDPFSLKNPDSSSIFNLGGLSSKHPTPESPSPVPVYTIPPEASLVRARGLTALIGRVPIDGQVTEPIPFKAIIGRDNLLANGHQLSQVERAIFSGVALGDATLHCVTGRIRQVTFIFADGTIATYPETGNPGDQSLGYISDAKGYPCIPGQYISNLNETISKITASSFAAGIAEAYSDQQVTVIRQSDQITRNLTGNLGEYAFGQGVAAGINQWARMIAERAAQTFDAVVVRPGTELSLHIEQAIPVNWHPEARKIRHLASAQTHSHRPGGLD